MDELFTWPGGDWKTCRLIGKGGFGSVYEIQREEFGRVYKAAMKVMRIPPDDSEIESMMYEGMSWEEISSYYLDYARRLAEEFALLAQLKGHTNIVSYEDHMLLRDPNGIGWTILIRMERLTPVKQYFRENKANEESIIKLGTDICAALEICHEKKIIHRDIKLDNIFVNARGDFKLGDFGIARITEKTMSSMTMTGTPAYMAPEVYRKERYGKNVDIYSLGIAMYMLLNKMRGPFYPVDRRITPEDRERALIDRTTGKEIPEPLYGSEKLKKAVLKAIAFKPENRFADAQEFRRALEGGEIPNSVRDEKRTAVEPEHRLKPQATYVPEPVRTYKTMEPKEQRVAVGGGNGEAAGRREQSIQPLQIKIPENPVPVKKKSRLPWIGGIAAICILAAMGIVFLNRQPGTVLSEEKETKEVLLTEVPDRDESELIETIEPSPEADEDNEVSDRDEPELVETVELSPGVDEDDEVPSRENALKKVLAEAVNAYEAFDYVEWCEFDLDWDGSDEVLIGCWNEHRNMEDYREYDIFRFDPEKMVYERLRDQHLTTEPWDDPIRFWEEEHRIAINISYEEIQYAYFTFEENTMNYIETVNMDRSDLPPLPFQKLEMDAPFAEETEMTSLSHEEKIQKCREWMSETNAEKINERESFIVRKQEILTDREDRFRKLRIPAGGTKQGASVYPGFNDLDAEYYFHDGMLYFIYLSYAKYEYKFYMENRKDGLYCIRYSGYDGDFDYPEGIPLEETGTEYVRLCKYGIPFGRY